ncbi:MAG: hypothetical protein DMG07_24805, partial [Acidobacteria bacterium]
MPHVAAGAAERAPERAAAIGLKRVRRHGHEEPGRAGENAPNIPFGCLNRHTGYINADVRRRTLVKSSARSASYDVAVVGAGVFGCWTAYHLQRAGRRVALVDAFGPGNNRASSGGESRVIRM